MRKLKVLQTLPELESGGVERGTLEIASSLIEHGHKPLVVSNGGSMVKTLEAMSVQHIKMSVHSKNIFKILLNIFRFYKLIRKLEVDIVHARSRIPAWIAFFACKAAGKNFITTFHGTYSIGNPFKRFYNSITLKGDQVIAISDFIKKHIETRYQFKSDKICVIHRGVDLDYFNPDNVKESHVKKLLTEINIKIPPKIPVILLPSRFSRWKGHLHLLSALSHLKDRDFLCLMIGKCTDNQHEYLFEIKQAIKDFGLSKKVFLYPKAVSDMPTLYSIADLVVSPSTEPEAFGRTVIEAQAMRKIVIATNLGGAAEVIENGVNGFLSSAKNSFAFAEAMNKALSLNKDSAEKIIKNAASKVKKMYSIKLMCDKTVAVYEKLCHIQK